MVAWGRRAGVRREGVLVASCLLKRGGGVQHPIHRLRTLGAGGICFSTAAAERSERHAATPRPSSGRWGMAVVSAPSRKASEPPRKHLGVVSESSRKRLGVISEEC